jgi:hypothetical protein
MSYCARSSLEKRKRKNNNKKGLSRSFSHWRFTAGGIIIERR